jgi:hypothetical protein
MTMTAHHLTNLRSRFYRLDLTFNKGELMRPLKRRSTLQSVHQANKSMGMHKHFVTRRPFVAEEDALLISLVESDAFGGWDTVARHFQGRSPRQCRERWLNYLSPEIRIQPWTPQEEEILSILVQLHGHRWSMISRFLPGRSENAVKNRWHWYMGHRFGEDCEWDRGEVKRRAHKRVDPRENALRLLAEFTFDESGSSTAAEIGPCKEEFDDREMDNVML